MRSLLLLALLGCVSELDATIDPKTDDWEKRAAAADDLLESGKLDELEPLLKDPEPRVREQAVLTYGLLAKRGGVKRLREIARTDSDPAVVSAALAAIAQIEHAYPAPPRGELVVKYPDKIFAGIPFAIRVRLASRDKAPRAHLVVQLPAGLVAADAKRPPRWQGSLDAPLDLTFELVATEDVRGGLRVHATLDYPEPYDLEKLHDRVGVLVAGGTGSFQPLPAVKVVKP
jgi:hypothetical protein